MAKLPDVLNDLRNYAMNQEAKGELVRVVVTGPQRSGTRIAATILAEELHYDYVDEREIDNHSLYKFYRLYFDVGRRPFVIQAPGLCSFAHRLSGAKVLVRRPVEHIIRSQERIGWGNEREELHHYFTDDGPIARVKYRAWDLHQKPFLDHACELDYESLRGHHLFVDETARANFGSDQTKPTEK
jgi:hypothetical protein